MEIKGDGTAIEFIIRTLIEHECGFVIYYWDGHDNPRVRIGFHKGAWKVMREDGTYFELNDCPEIQECADPVLKGFIEQRLGRHDRSGMELFRVVPALVIVETLRIWANGPDKVEKIEVISSVRNNWFTSLKD